MHGKSWLPAYPVRAACEHLKDPELSGLALFEGVRAAVATQFNNTGDQTCFYNGDGASSLSTEGGTVWPRCCTTSVRRCPCACGNCDWRM